MPSRPPFYVFVVAAVLSLLLFWWMVGTVETMSSGTNPGTHSGTPDVVRDRLFAEVVRRYGLEDLPVDAYHAMIGRAGQDRALLDLYLLLFTPFNKTGAFDIRRFNIHARHGRVRPVDSSIYFQSGAPMYTVEDLQRALAPGLNLRLHVVGTLHGMGVDSDPATAEELAALAAANLESITGTYPPPIVLDKLVPLEQLRAQESIVRRFPRYEDIPSMELFELLQKNPALSDLGLRLRYSHLAASRKCCE